MLRSCPNNTARRISAAIFFCALGYSLATAGNAQGNTATEDAIPALAKLLNDPMSTVRIAAAKSLEDLTRTPGQAAWGVTVAPLTRMLGSKNSEIRLAAVKALAVDPCDISAAAPALRRELRRAPAERDYALTALFHAAQADRLQTLSAFTRDLSSSDTHIRRDAASDLSLTATLLWNGEFWPDAPPLPSRWDDARLSTVFTPSDQEEARRRAEASESARLRLLSALAFACGDSDHAVSEHAGAALEKIALYVDNRIGTGARPAGQKTNEIMNALDQAAAALQAAHPDLAKALVNVRQDFERFHAAG